MTTIDQIREEIAKMYADLEAEVGNATQPDQRRVLQRMLRMLGIMLAIVAHLKP